MIFYESFYEAAKYLNPEDKSAFLNAVLEYGCEGKVPELKGVPMAMFLMAKPIIDANNARKQNGSKGGRPKKEKSTGRFNNFEPSGTDYNAVAEKIINEQLNKETAPKT